MNTSNMWLVYADTDGQHHHQPWQDVDTVGTLIDEQGDDMEMIGWTTTNPDDADDPDTDTDTTDTTDNDTDNDAACALPANTLIFAPFELCCAPLETRSPPLLPSRPIIGPRVQTLLVQKARPCTALANQVCQPLSTAHDLIRRAWISEETHRHTSTTTSSQSAASTQQPTPSTQTGGRA
jgi:hypothetical protein